MTPKCLEVRDAMTFIPVVAIDTSAANEGQRYLLRRAGYSHDGSAILLVNLNDARASNDPYGWGGSRTMTGAHLYIEAHWDTLQDGDVVDVEFIRGETEFPKKSERHDG